MYILYSRLFVHLIVSQYLQHLQDSPSQKTLSADASVLRVDEEVRFPLCVFLFCCRRHSGISVDVSVLCIGGFGEQGGHASQLGYKHAKIWCSL